MSDNPLVSVVIPVYNVENYLRQCMDSVVNQTYSNLEIVCVNDGSPDRSIDILRDYEQKDKRIRIVEIENQGAYTTLAPGASVSWTVRWSVVKTDLEPAPSKALLKLAKKLAK